MKYLVLGPGAMAFFAILGHMSTIDLSNVKEISGSSAGSILGFLLCIGLSPKEILDCTLSIDIEKIYQTKKITSLLKNYGMIDISLIKNALLECSYGLNPTFKELDKVLHVSAFCLNTRNTVYFNKHTHPDMKVIDAVVMSIGIPFIFSSVEYNGYRYIDGCVEETLPLGPFLGKSQDDIYSIEVQSEYINMNNKIQNIKDFCLSIISVIVKSRYKHYVKHKKIIYVNKKDSFNFCMSQQDKLEMYSRGFS